MIMDNKEVIEIFFEFLLYILLCFEEDPIDYIQTDVCSARLS